MKDWEEVADNLHKVGWSWGCVSALDLRGRTIFVADALRDVARLGDADGGVHFTASFERL